MSIKRSSERDTVSEVCDEEPLSQVNAEKVLQPRSDMHFYITFHFDIAFDLRIHKINIRRFQIC